MHGEERKLLLTFGEFFIDQLAQFVNGKGNERHWNERNERQSPVAEEHHRQYHQKRHERIGRIHDAGTDRIAD